MKKLLLKLLSVLIILIIPACLAGSGNQSRGTTTLTKTSDERVCGFAQGKWGSYGHNQTKWVKEVKRRGLVCNTQEIKQKTQTKINTTSKKSYSCTQKLPQNCSVDQLCKNATFFQSGILKWRNGSLQSVKEAKKRKLTCGINQHKTVKKSTKQISSTSRNSTELKQLQEMRDQLEANLLATQQLMEQQKRQAERPYKACLSNCLLNNKAGKGFAAALSGMAQCNSSCAPLKWGGAIIPPTWERDMKKLKRYDCMITKLNKNQASMDCNQF
tara:strand:- start:3180 stop:3992 length:813 start_codon:yes stop_codon:yes gene_type:complete